MARRAGGTGWAAWIEGTLGGIELLQGDLEAAEALDAASLEHATTSTGDEPLAGNRHAELACMLSFRGRNAEAAEEYRARSGDPRRAARAAADPASSGIWRRSSALDAGAEEEGVELPVAGG